MFTIVIILSSQAGSPARPDGVVLGRSPRGAGASAQGRAAPTATPRAERSGIEERIGHNSAQRRPTVTVVHASLSRGAPRLHDYPPRPSHEPSRRSASRTAAAGRRGPGDENTGYCIELRPAPARRPDGLVKRLDQFCGHCHTTLIWTVHTNEKCLQIGRQV